MPQTEPCLIVIFGASGDLTARKLIPALYEQAQAKALPPQTIVLGVARSEKSDDAWRADLEPWAREHAEGFDEAAWKAFAPRLFYHAADATSADAYTGLKQRIEELSCADGRGGNVLFYLAVAPSLYEPIVERIDGAGLVTEGKRWCAVDRNHVPWQRIVIEKPFGHDAESAASLNRTLGRTFEEESIYRIDHYLGKEVVQGIFALRFANTIFEPLWSNQYIDHVQITAAETVGVGDRVGFYDQTGAIRDMIQTHLLQVLGLVAMEPPTAYGAHHIRHEKVQVIEAIRVTPPDDVATSAALGQYGGDATEGAYHTLPGVAQGSTTETYAAIMLHIDNWRWSGTPFYLRTGKRLARKSTEIVIQFKQPPANLFRTLANGTSDRPANRIVIEIAPRQSIAIQFEGKVPGSGMTLDSVAMDFDYASRFHSEPVEAYGPLLLDVMRGDQTLFKSRFEVEASWAAVMPFLGPESASIRRNLNANYAPGSWGPAAADELMARGGRRWHNV